MRKNNDFPYALKFAGCSAVACIIAFVLVGLLVENPETVFIANSVIGLLLFNLLVIVPLIKVGTLSHMESKGYKISDAAAWPTLGLPLLVFLTYVCMIFNPANVRGTGDWQSEWLATCAGINIFIDFCYMMYCGFKGCRPAQSVSS